MYASRRYPITAYALCSALGRTTKDTVVALSQGRSGLVPPQQELPFETFCGSVGGDLPPLPEKLLAYDTRLLRMVFSTYLQIEAQVLGAVARYGPERVAVILGTSTGGIEQTEMAHRHLLQQGRIPEDYDFERHHPFHLTSEVLALAAGIIGPKYVISTACSSGGKTLAAAQRLIDTGVVDAALTGAVDGLCQTTLRGFHSLSILSPVPCRPFSSAHSGISIGEGVGLLLLEREGQSGVELLGVGESSDAYHMSSPDPEGKGALVAMTAALTQAGLNKTDVDHINAHGTGTKHNDAAESRAIYELFGDEVPVVSTKGYTGHLLGAGGAVEAIFAMVALEQGWIPASLGAEPVDEEIHINVNLEKRDHPCRVVLSNSFGFGGSNVSVLLGAAS